jgi:hypothetical protein
MVLALPYLNLEHAVCGGAIRELHGRLLGRKHYFPNTRPYEHNVDSAVGEAAVSWANGKAWFPVHADPRGVVDVGKRGQVRNTSRRGEPCLRVYAHDRDDHAFILTQVVLGAWTGPTHFHDAEHPCVKVIGWLWGFEVKQERFRAHYPNGGDCWEAPPDALRPLPPLPDH